MEKEVAVSVQVQTMAEAITADLTAKQERMTQQMAVDRTTAVKELQQYKDRVAEKDRAIKAINTALADTPENVLKKMKALKKEKQDEADALKRVEASLAALRKEKRDEDQQLKEAQENGEKTGHSMPQPACALHQSPGTAETAGEGHENASHHRRAGHELLEAVEKSGL